MFKVDPSGFIQLLVLVTAIILAEKMSNSKTEVASTIAVPEVLSDARRPALVDSFGRVHRSLRISVTDACNIRCQYCMPAEQVTFLKPDKLLSFDEIIRVVGLTTKLGISRYRITGGEPLVRPNLHRLIAGIKQIDGVADVAITTNGMLLSQQLETLLEAGLSRINISLDTLQSDIFRQLSRRDGLDQVLAGIESAVDCRRVEVKLNALILRDVNLNDVVDLARFAVEKNVELRFIEFMPLDADRSWTSNNMVSGDELRQILAREFGELLPVCSTDPSRPASSYRTANGGAFGFIDSVTQPFCSSCDRLRLTADGKLRNCLFGKEEWDVRDLLRAGGTATEIEQRLFECVASKYAGHGISEPSFVPPERAMYQIGG